MDKTYRKTVFTILIALICWLILVILVNRNADKIDKVLTPEVDYTEGISEREKL
jgi:hypothetical protein